MRLQLSDFAVAQLDAATAPLALNVFRLGSGCNYIPTPEDTDLHGAQVYAGTISPAVVENANIVKYSCYMDYNTGDFDFGEVAIMYEGQLFALGVSDVLISKIRAGTTLGNSIRLDIFLSMVGDNYGMWVDVAESNNQFQMASLSTPDQLPPSHMATPNVYIISGADSKQGAYQAYTDRNGLWNFDAYQYFTTNKATITACDSHSVTINMADFSPDMEPLYFGDVLLEFITGDLYSICRYVKTCVQSGSTVTLGFDTVLAELPVVGDRVMVFKRQLASALPPLPIATADTLGGIKIGFGLKITPEGVCSVDAGTLGAVTSVNGKSGVVILNAEDINGLATVAKTGNYSDLIGAPAPYSLPPMSKVLRGGARLPANGNLVITGGDVLDLSFAPVKYVNNVAPDAGGNVDLSASIVGLVNPKAIPATSSLDSYTTAGLFTVTAGVAATLLNTPINNAEFTLEVVPCSITGSGESIQRVLSGSLMYWRKGSGSTWTAWNQVATNAIATNLTVGVVRIGTGLSIDSTGLLTPAIATTATPGMVRIGSGLAVDGAGLLTLNAPIATTSSLGMVKVGAGLLVDGVGTLSVNAASLPIATTTTLGVVKIGSGLIVDGAGLVKVDTEALKAATGTAAGVVKIGTGLSVAPDGTISVDYAQLPVASTTVKGIMQVGTGLSVSAGLVSANLRTVNGVSPDGSGNVTVAADSNKLDRVNGVAVGIRLTFLNLNTVGSGGTVSVATNSANVMAATFTGGAVTWAFSGWPAAGTYAETQVELINAGLATHTFPAAVKWYNPDGTQTTNFATYIGNKRSGATNFQSSGTDFVVFWTRDGGTTVYAMVM